MGTHLHSVDIPIDGEVPVWMTDHWEFDSGVIAEHGLSGDGSSALPLKLVSKYNWGEGPSGGTGAEAPDLRLWGTDSTMGDPVYVDTGGFVRSMPQVIPDASSKPATDLPGTYPQGMSIMSLYTATAAAKGWPDGASCTVITYRRHGDADASPNVHQWWYENPQGGLNARVMTRFGGTPGWTVWHQLPLSYGDIPANTDLNTYLYPGQYAQTANANTSTALNYPVPAAGLLEVSRSAEGIVVWQRYTIYGAGGALATNLTYTRSKNGSSGWSPWVYLPAALPVVAPITNAFTPAAGWTVETQSLYRVQTNLMACSVKAKRSGGTLSIDPDGNMANIDVAVMSSSYPKPLMSQCGLATHDTGRVVAVQMWDTRIARITAIGGPQDIVNGNEISFGGLFPVVP